MDTEEGLVAGGRAGETGPGLELLTTPDLVNRLLLKPVSSQAYS